MSLNLSDAVVERPPSREEIAAWLRRHPELGGERDGARTTWRLEDAAVEILRQSPGRGLTARCRLALVRPGGVRRRLTVIAKLYVRRDLARRLARHLRSLRFEPGGPGVRTPRLLGLDSRRGLVFMETLPGTSLEAALASAGGEHELEAAGSLLALLHRGTARVEKRVTRAGELQRTAECIAMIAREFPVLAPRLERLKRALGRTPWPRAGRRSLLHGSFRPSHLLLHRGALSVFDLESLRLGPAGYDLANWAAALHYRELDQRISAGARRRATRALVRGYAAGGGRESCTRVLWLTAGLLVQKQLLKVAIRPRMRSAARARTLLGRAEELAARAAAARPGAGLDRLEELLP